MQLAGTFKLTAAERSKRHGKACLTPLDGTVQKGCTVLYCTVLYCTVLYCTISNVLQITVNSFFTINTFFNIWLCNLHRIVQQRKLEGLCFFQSEDRNIYIISTSKVESPVSVRIYSLATQGGSSIRSGLSPHTILLVAVHVTKVETGSIFNQNENWNHTALRFCEIFFASC